MNRQQLSEDRDYAKTFAQDLSEQLGDLEFRSTIPADGCDTSPEVNVAETYEEAGVLTRDAGLVLQMSDGAQVRLTIQAYTPAGGR